MYRFSISFILLFLGYTIGFSQTKNDSIVTVKDSLNVSEFYHPKKYGFRFGADIIKPIISLTNNEFDGFELVGDYRISTKNFIAAEMGYVTKSDSGFGYSYKTKGSYYKLGFNHNMYTNWLDMDNEIYFGFRYGLSLFTNDLNGYTISQQGIDFEKRTISNKQSFDGLNAHWLELIFGVKTEILNNLFLGVAVNFNQMVFQKEPDNFQNLYIPGFGEIKGNGSAGINYTISYRIPLYKK